MPEYQPLKILFVINPVSGGKDKVNWKEDIQDYYKKTDHNVEFYKLTGKGDKPALKNHIAKFNPAKVVAVGGDGTIKLVAELLLNSSICLGILPAGSANGMAKELCIPADINEALNIVTAGIAKKISVITINDTDISIHLSDMGLNALLVKYFEEGSGRGMWGYAKAVLRVFKAKRLMRIELKINNQTLKRAAFMIVIANSRTYGTGAVINPQGDLYDNKFEVIIVRRLLLGHLFNMLFSHKPFNPANIEVIQTEEVNIHTNKKNHFQVDGEYKGKIDQVNAKILPLALRVLLPPDNKK